MTHGDAREGKWRGNWRMEWVASTLHTTSEHGVSSITTLDAHTLAASIRLNWRHCRFKWTRLFRQETKSGFCACAITFQLASTRFGLDSCTRPLHTVPWRHEMSAIWRATSRSVGPHLDPTTTPPMRPDYSQVFHANRPETTEHLAVHPDTNRHSPTYRTQHHRHCLFFHSHPPLQM
jgi:hypothetical protein